MKHLRRFNLIQKIKVLNLSGRLNEVGSLIYGEFSSYGLPSVSLYF